MIRQFSEPEIEDMAAFYEEHGAVRLSQLISTESAARLLDIVDETARRAEQQLPDGSDLSFGKGEGRMTIRYMWREIPEVRDFLLRSELAEALGRITGAEELRFWFDLTFIHNGLGDGKAGEGTGWHHDIAAFGFKGLKLPSLWLALTPSREDTSRLQFIDGSHKTVPGYFRTELMEERPGDGMLAILDYDALVAEGKEHILTWDCDPGDALIIHPYTIHGAKGNQGDGIGKRRVAITTRWLGEDCRWLPIAGWGTHLPGIRDRQMVMGSRPSGDYFPVVYSRSK